MVQKWKIYSHDRIAAMSNLKICSSVFYDGHLNFYHGGIGRLADLLACPRSNFYKSIILHSETKQIMRVIYYNDYALLSDILIPLSVCFDQQNPENIKHISWSSVIITNPPKSKDVCEWLTYNNIILSKHENFKIPEEYAVEFKLRFM